MSVEYVLKTDRQKQWKKIEKQMSETASRKNIKICRDCFFENNIRSEHFRWSDRLGLYFNPTLEGWQNLFDEELSVELNDQDFSTLQTFFAGQLADDFFCIEDQDYYFKSAFGATYNPKKRFSLRINREKECRVNTLSHNKMLRFLKLYFSRYLEGDDDAGVLRYNLEYYNSLLPLVDLRFFSMQKYETSDHTEDDVRIAAVQSGTKKIIEAAYSQPSKTLDQARIDAAKQVLDVLQQNAAILGEFTQLHDNVCAELEKKSKKKSKKK